MLQENEHFKKEEELSKQGANAGFCQQSEKKSRLPNINILASLQYNKIIF